MSISRRKPKTVKETEQALTKAKARMDAVTDAEMALTPATQAALTEENVTFLDLIALMVVALYNQLKATNLKDTAQGMARMFVSHYFQVYFLGITRGVYDKESRVLYGLKENQNAVPSIGSEADLTYWGGKIKTGDAARVTAGGAAMSNPTAAQVQAKMVDYNEKNTAQGLTKTAFTSAQENTMNELANAIKVVIKAWDETETFYDELPIEAKRAKCREWGVVYESTEKMTINVTVKNSVTAAILAGATTTVVESGTEHISDAAGNEVIETNIAFGVTLETGLDGYVTNTTDVEFETGVSVYNVVIEMVPV